MEIVGKLVKKLPVQTGTSAKGQWSKQDVVIETYGEYPKKVCITFWGDKIDVSKIEPNIPYVFDIDIESREYNDKWFSDIKCFKMNKQTGNAPADKYKGKQESERFGGELPVDDEVNQNLPF